MRRLFELKPAPPKVDPHMSAPYSPTGKRLTRPIVAGVLRNPLSDPELEARLAAHRAEIRKLGIALVLWCAFLALLYIYTVDYTAR